MNIAAKSEMQQEAVPLLTPFLSSMIGIYTLSRVFQVYPGPLPMLAVVALHVFPPALFALAHGALIYGRRGIVTFICLCLLIGNLIENVGATTGFPFGNYYFTDVMGPKLFHVNVMLGLAYVGMAYLSWIVAAIILDVFCGRLSGRSVVTLPLLAALIMTSWDLSMDPIWSTVKHAWIWVHGGAYFGVPVSNFVGWYLDVYLIYQSFALYLWKRSLKPPILRSNYLNLALLFYAVSAVGNLLLLLPSKEPPILTDPAGVQWKLSAITATCALVTVLTMGTFALLAWVRLGNSSAPVETQTAVPRQQTTGQP